MSALAVFKLAGAVMLAEGHLAAGREAKAAAVLREAVRAGADWLPGYPGYVDPRDRPVGAVSWPAPTWGAPR